MSRREDLSGVVVPTAKRRRRTAQEGAAGGTLRIGPGRFGPRRGDTTSARVRRFAAAFAAGLTLCAFPATAQSPKHGVGRAPTAEETKAWDISIPPDGTGLPAGQGTVEEGAKVYQARCQECHGAEAKGGDEAPLVGGHDTLATAKPLKTATGYWPYATTLFDYTRRAMPFKDPGILTDNQVYAVVAYLLSLDGIIEKDAVMNAETLPKVKMPNRDGFIRDPRPGVQPQATQNR